LYKTLKKELCIVLDIVPKILLAGLIIHQLHIF